mgnify:CR=1 FL=1
MPSKRLEALRLKAKLIAMGIVMTRQQNAMYNRIQQQANTLLEFYQQRERERV